MKRRFNFVFRKSCIKWDRSEGAPYIKYPIITFNNFLYSRAKLLAQILAIVFFVNFDTIVIHTKNVWLHYIMKSQHITLLFWASCLSKQVNFHQGYLVFFFTIYAIVLQTDRNLKGEIFVIMPNCFFDLTNFQIFL